MIIYLEGFEDMTVLAAITLENIEDVPLALYSPGGIALIFNFCGCNENCRYCPWSVNISNDLCRKVVMDSKTIYSKLSKYHPDIIVFRGADPYLCREFDMFKDISIKLKETLRCSLCIKIDLLVLKKYLGLIDTTAIANLFRDFDVFLITVRYLNKENRDQLEKLINNIISLNAEHIEILFIGDELNDSTANNLIEFLKLLRIYHEKGYDIPAVLYYKNIVFRRDLGLDREELEFESQREEYKEIPLTKILKYFDMFRSIWRHVYIPNHSIVELSSILCPRCGNQVFLRSASVALKSHLSDDTKCKYCGYQVIRVPAKKIRSMLIREVVV